MTIHDEIQSLKRQMNALEKRTAPRMEYALVVYYGQPMEAQDLMNRKAAEGWTVVSVSGENSRASPNALYDITLARPRS